MKQRNLTIYQLGSIITKSELFRETLKLDNLDIPMDKKTHKKVLNVFFFSAIILLVWYHMVVLKQEREREREKSLNSKGQEAQQSTALKIQELESWYQVVFDLVDPRR